MSSTVGYLAHLKFILLSGLWGGLFSISLHCNFLVLSIDLLHMFFWLYRETMLIFLQIARRILGPQSMAELLADLFIDDE